MIQTRHPLGKANFPVSKERYELFKGAIVAALQEEELTHTELVQRVTERLEGSFDGNVSWHVMTVKLDLEAAGLVSRTTSRPQRYRLA